jgi:thioredoxin-related protein
LEEMLTMRLTVRLFTALVLLAPACSFAQEIKPSEKPKTSIYDVKADAKEQIKVATARARADSKRVLVMFGGDWCGWCHKLHALFDSDKAVQSALYNEYVLVMVDTKAPNAQELLDECKGDLGNVGYPFLAVLDGNGKVVTRQKTDPLEEGDHHDPKKVTAFLEQWVAPKASAETVLNDAIAKAKSEDKLVFLHFGAPWCGWCHKLDDFLAREDVAKIIGKDFVEVKIDQDRMIGGKDVHAKIRPDFAKGGIPWFAFLDSTGKILVTSDGAKGNIGYPAAPEEIAHFVSMLKKVARSIDSGQIDMLEKALKEEAAKIEQQQRERAAKRVAVPRVAG